MQGIHGGDIYNNHVYLDFSVNGNPLGVSEAVKRALHDAVESSSTYPDMTAGKLKKAVSDMLSVSEEQLIFGNGASELFLAVVHALQPKKTVIPVPSFYGYEYAAGAAAGEIVYFPMQVKEQFALSEALFPVLDEGAELLFLANPNNPTGKLPDREYVKKLLSYCKRKHITVVLDECFIEFCDSGASFLQETARFDNLILVRAFTKSFSIPGVRLGYLVCSNRLVCEKIRRHLPEWNLSVFAQAAGVACAAQVSFLEETKEYVRAERQFLEESLRQMGFQVFPGEADFLLFYSEKSLYEPLLERGILIRDCGNFRGLSSGYYRIAVKSREENRILLRALGEVR